MVALKVSSVKLVYKIVYRFVYPIVSCKDIKISHHDVAGIYYLSFNANNYRSYLPAPFSRRHEYIKYYPAD